MPPLPALARVLVFFGVVGAACAAETTFRSGRAPVALIELYTSEGCSSCPPAEQWLGALREDKGLWTSFVPVAFHVNYWDHLGWRDALAAKAYTEREYAYAEAWRAGSVYTPCFVRNGEEWRPRDRTSPDGDGKGEAGTLVVTWQADTRTARVDYTAPKSGKPPATLEARVALLGGGIVTDVRKGENAGRALRHEFVALRLESVRLAAGGNGTWSGTVRLEPRADITAPRQALAAWVTARGQLTPLQAAGGWLEK